MATTKELRERRGSLEKKFQDIVNKAEAEDRDLTAEEEATLATINTDDLALKNRIERQEQLANLGRELDEPQDRKISGRGSHVGDDFGRDGADALAPDAQMALALRGWAKAQMGHDITDQEQHACSATGISAARKNLSVGLGNWQDSRSQYRNALTTGQPTKGGVLIPTGPVQQLEMALLAHGAMLQVASLQDTDQGNEIPFPTINDTDNEGEWKGENQASGQQDIVTGGTVLRAYEVSSKMIIVSQPMLEDSAFDLVSMIFGALGERIGRAGNRGFTTGDGVGKPRGVVTSAVSAATTASATAVTADELLGLIHSVDPAYRADPSFALMFNDATALAIRKLKDGNGQYLWSNIADSVGTRFGGVPVVINQHMPSLVASAKAIIAGAFSHYKIRRVKSVSIRRLTEKYADQNADGFIGFIRMDGGLVDAGTHPIKCLTQHA